MIENCFCRHLQCVKIQKSRRCQHMHCDNEAHFASFHDPPSTEKMQILFIIAQNHLRIHLKGRTREQIEQKLRSNFLESHNVPTFLCQKQPL